VLKEVRKAADLLETGPAEELLIRTDKIATVLRIVNDDYFVALALRQMAIWAKPVMCSDCSRPSFGRSSSNCFLFLCDELLPLWLGVVLVFFRREQLFRQRNFYYNAERKAPGSGMRVGF